MAIDYKQVRAIMEPGVREWVKTSGLPELLRDMGKAMHEGKLSKDEARELLLGFTKELSEAVNPGLRAPPGWKP